MTADTLLTALQAAGLHVVEQRGWKTRGKKWATDGKPEGVMQHHTAPPNPYPIKKLYGLRIKANMATHEDGTLYLIAYRACNYSSGPGSKVVLTENVRKSVAPTANARQRGLRDTFGWGGNRYYFNYENSHPGDGSPIPQIQLDTIIESTRIVLDHFGLNANQVISHAEHSRRKIDPFWGGSNRTAINQIRADIKKTIMLTPEEEPTVLTADETQFVRDLRASYRLVGSNATAPQYMIPWYRQWRDTEPQDFAAIDHTHDG